MNQQLATQEVNLPQSQKELVSLRVGHKCIKDLDRSVVAKHCAAILTKASFEMGSPMAEDPNILEFQKNALVGELKGAFGTLTLPELSESFRRGIRGESGPYFGMCPKTYHQFIKWFYELPERGKSWLAYLDTLSDAFPKSETPKVYTKEDFKRIANKAFQEYKEKGVMPFFPHAIYDAIKTALDVKSLIPQEHWKEIRAKGIEDHKNKFISGKRKSKVEEVLKNLDLSDGSCEFSIKKVALKYYFDELIKEGKDLLL